MPNTTYTFSGPIHQSRFELVDDPSKPGWDDIPTLSEESTEEEYTREHRLFGNGIRKLINVLRKR